MKKLFYILPIITLIAVGCGEANNQDSQNQQNQNSQQSQTNTQPTAPKTPESDNQSWTGVLKKSDNLQKGNLMLVQSNTTTYIKTSRDFSSLIGKSVIVTYEGSASNFVLGNIFEQKGE